MSPIVGAISARAGRLSLSPLIPRFRVRIIVRPIVVVTPDLTTSFLLAAGALFLSGLSMYGLFTR